MEIERKFWIDTLPDLPEERRSDVYQGYLCTEPVELRIRKRVEAGGEMVYQLIHKEFHAYRLSDGHLLECSIVDGGVFSYAEVEFASEADALAWIPLDCLGKETTYEQGVSMRDYWKNR